MCHMKPTHDHVLNAAIHLHSLALDGRVDRVPKENEPRQPDTPSRAYHQAPRADCLGGQDSQAALHCGWMA